MPARRSTAGTSRGSASGETSPQSEDPAYKLKRKKNNEAVQRTREKTRQSAVERKKRIEKLKEENIKLTQSIKLEKNHINVLRKMIINGRKNEEQDRLIDEILNNPEYADDNRRNEDDPVSDIK
ncbi:CCAAT/enhancer-binding protein gamma [Drosophila nasuta]|uniref:CCAAT/enhancer-binding protein gamma n=1 Tax=Drosophila albomicans TaxID=7291 RepID=A0A6P8WLI7_DROAB|nr:CCAAT/enhancer-binding protein gamma [Drosophila albomicans]XP_060652734.1 CCAAT/enhancer-binding protein gamma [Drosophila nasuta]